MIVPGEAPARSACRFFAIVAKIELAKLGTKFLAARTGRCGGLQRMLSLAARRGKAAE
jgi:hypothetical protein